MIGGDFIFATGLFTSLGLQFSQESIHNSYSKAAHTLCICTSVFNSFISLCFSVVLLPIILAYHSYSFSFLSFSVHIQSFRPLKSHLNKATFLNQSLYLIPRTLQIYQTCSSSVHWGIGLQWNHVSMWHIIPPHNLFVMVADYSD